MDKIDKYAAAALCVGALGVDEVWHRAIIGFVLAGATAWTAFRAGRASKSRV